jgi:hypothetical protein
VDEIIAAIMQDMTLPEVAPDPCPAKADEDGADEIEGGINRRKVGNGDHVKIVEALKGDALER